MTDPLITNTRSPTLNDVITSWRRSQTRLALRALTLSLRPTKSKATPRCVRWSETHAGRGRESDLPLMEDVTSAGSLASRRWLMKNGEYPVAWAIAVLKASCRRGSRRFQSRLATATLLVIKSDLRVECHRSTNPIDRCK